MDSTLQQILQEMIQQIKEIERLREVIKFQETTIKELQNDLNKPIIQQSDGKK